jgi:hypothetical protein
VRYRLPPPQRELRWYPRGAWQGWRPLGTPLDADFDDPGEVNAIIERVRRRGAVGAEDAIPPASGDSWRSFCHDHGTYGFDWSPQPTKPTQPTKPSRAQLEQERWEAAQRERRRTQQAEADAAWRAEEQRRARAMAEHIAAWQQIRHHQSAEQHRLHDTLMDRWNALVARKGWSPDEAATYWNEWLHAPPGFFG